MSNNGNKVLGIIMIIISAFFVMGSLALDITGLGIFMILFCGVPGVFLMFFDPIKAREKSLDRKTSNIHEMTSEGYIHTKDKTTHVGTYQDTVHSSHEYITRIQTPIGFYDVHDKDSYMSYKEGDKVKILVRTRYNKKDKPFMQEVTILGLLAPDMN